MDLLAQLPPNAMIQGPGQVLLHLHSLLKLTSDGHCGPQEADQCGPATSRLPSASTSPPGTGAARLASSGSPKGPFLPSEAWPWLSPRPGHSAAAFPRGQSLHVAPSGQVPPHRAHAPPPLPLLRPGVGCAFTNMQTAQSRDSGSWLHVSDTEE